MAIELTDIYEYLDNVGIKHSNIGYRYLVMAIQSGSEHMELLFKINDLYVVIAERFNKSPQSVGSSIRNAISFTNQPNKEFIVKSIMSINMSENNDSN